MVRGASSAAACLVLALLSWPAATAYASGVSVQAVDADEPVVVGSADIAALADVGPTRYRLRGEGEVSTVTRSGTRLATVLRAAGLDPASLPSLELTRDDGTVLYLSRDQIDPPAGAPPLVSVHGRSVSFLRNSSGPGDLNARDSFTSASGTPIRVTVSPLAVLNVSVEADSERVRPGQPVTFSGTVGGALPGEQLSFEWRFGDGRSFAGAAEARHRFAGRGRYEVVLSVTGERQSGGSSEPVTVQVGRPKPRAEREGGGRSEAPRAPAGGAKSGAPGAGGVSGAGAPSPGPRPSSPPAPEPEAPEPASDAEQDAPPEPSGTAVRGLALGEARPDPERAQNSALPLTAARSGRQNEGIDLGFAAGALATLALVGWGALGEWLAKGRRRRRR